LGDEGLALLADALPPTLSHLNLSTTGCGDGGMVAIAAAMPALVSLTVRFCAANPAVGEAGWVALGAALPGYRSCGNSISLTAPEWAMVARPRWRSRCPGLSRCVTWT
jgi:hypothetical protein